MTSVYEELNHLISMLREISVPNEELERRIRKAVQDLKNLNGVATATHNTFVPDPTLAGVRRLQRVLEIIRDSVVPIAIRAELAKLEALQVEFVNHAGIDAVAGPAASPSPVEGSSPGTEPSEDVTPPRGTQKP